MPHKLTGLKTQADLKYHLKTEKAKPFNYHRDAKKLFKKNFSYDGDPWKIVGVLPPSPSSLQYGSWRHGRPLIYRFVAQNQRTRKVFSFSFEELARLSEEELADNQLQHFKRKAYKKPDDNGILWAYIQALERANASGMRRNPSSGICDSYFCEGCSENCCDCTPCICCEN